MTYGRHPLINVLISAYACAPNRGSEPGIGWNTVVTVSDHCKVFVITRTNNRSAIEEELAHHPRSNVAFYYCDLPRWLLWWKRGPVGVHIYYYVWQIIAYFAARKLSKSVTIDVSHHITFGRFWAPSFLAFFPAPLLWGPVGGGDSAPLQLVRGLGRRGNIANVLRNTARWIGTRDPAVRFCAKTCSIALGATPDTVEELRRLGVRQAELMPAVGLSVEDMQLFNASSTESTDSKRLTLLCVGELIYWKGFKIAIEAFSRANIGDSTLCIVGDGPERAALQNHAAECRVHDRVEFLGRIPRQHVLRLFSGAVALVHPSLHDSGGWVCLEAMAAKLPVICLDLGGPAALVTRSAGVLVKPTTWEFTCRDLAIAMERIVKDNVWRNELGENGRQRILKHFLWPQKGKEYLGLYHRVRNFSKDDYAGTSGQCL